MSRLLEHRWREADAILLGSFLMVPSVALGGIGVASTWPMPIIFAAFFCMGASIGFVSTSGLTLLQSSADDGEMGRVNSAHQFVRTICITYGVAVGGAILLLVVDRQIGDVEVVRDALGGEDVTASAGDPRRGPRRTRLGARVQAVVAVACVAAAAQLWRNTRARARIGVGI